MSVVFATLSLKQRTVFNNMSLPLGVKFVSRGELVPQGWTCPPGVNLSPRGELDTQGWTWPPMGELCTLGESFNPSFNPRSENSPMFRRTEGQSEGLHPWGITPLIGANLTPVGHISPLGANFIPGG
jgi:hypothetical protein